MDEVERIARKLRSEGCEFVPEGTVKAADHRAGLQNKVAHRLDKLWREGDPPSEQLLRTHRETRRSA